MSDPTATTRRLVRLVSRLRLALGGGLIAGPLGILFLNTGWGFWGILSGFSMGFVYGAAVALAPDGGGDYEHVFIGGTAGALAASVGWWLDEGAMSMQVWALVGAVLGAVFWSSGRELADEL